MKFIFDFDYHNPKTVEADTMRIEESPTSISFFRNNESSPIVKVNTEIHTTLTFKKIEIVGRKDVL